MGAVRTVISECYKNRRRMVAVAKYNLRFQNIHTKLNFLWAILNPILQSATYFIAYHVGLRISSPIDGIPYLAWMLTGLMPWFCISNMINQGTNSILSARAIVKSMKYPMATIPISTVMTEMLSHFIYMIVLVAVQLISGVKYNIGILWIFYYMFALFCFMLGYTFVFSTLTVFIRDIQKIVNVVIRLLFFITPICWQLVPDTPLAKIMYWNPIMYIIDGYRQAMLYGGVMTADIIQHIYFWILTLVLIILGMNFHCKLRGYFIDYM